MNDNLSSEEEEIETLTSSILLNKKFTDTRLRLTEF